MAREPNKKQNAPQSQEASVSIDWHIPDESSVQFANHLIAQQDGHHFYFSFFQLPPPVLLGSDEEKAKQLTEMGSVRANCVARIAVNKSLMPGFMKAIQQTMKALEPEPNSNVRRQQHEGKPQNKSNGGNDE